MTQTLNILTARELLKQVVEGNEARNAACVYVRDGSPHCIVAHVLAAFGAPPSDIELAAGRTVQHARQIWSKAGWSLTSDAAGYLAKAQSIQDDGVIVMDHNYADRTWGTAYKLAEAWWNNRNRIVDDEQMSEDA